MQALRDRVQGVAGDGRYELYKTSIAYDGVLKRAASTASRRCRRVPA